MAKFQELSLFDVIEQRKNRYEFSFATTFNAYLPFYEQIVLRRLVKAGCHVNTLLMDAGQFAASMNDPSGKPFSAGRDYTIIPVDASRGVFHPKILLLLGREHASLCVGSHNLTLSGFGKNRELTAVFEVGPSSPGGERRIFRDAWKALRFWANNQPEELLDSLLYVEKEVPWLIQADDESPAENSGFFYAANKNGLSLWEQVYPVLPKQIRRATLISPFFDEDLNFLQKIKDDLKLKQFIVGIEPTTVQLSPKAQSLFPDIKFVETGNLRSNRGYLHAKAIYLETEMGEEVLITGSANASGAAWLDGGGRSNCEAVIVLRSEDAASAVKALGLRELAKSYAIESKDWQLIERNKLKRRNLFAEKERQFLLTAIETNAGFKILLKNTETEFDPIIELINAHGETIVVGEIADFSNQYLFIAAEDSQIRFSTNTIKLNSTAGESYTAFVHHTPAIVAKFHKATHREFFAALESFDIPADDKFWRLFEKIVFVEGDELPDYAEAQVSLRNESQNLRVRGGDSETLQESFSVKTADIGFKERLYRNSLDSVGELISFLNRRLYMPSETFQNPSSNDGSTDEFNEPEEYETEEIVDPKFEIERVASFYYQKTRTMMRRMIKKLTSTSAAENSVRLAAIRQLVAVLGILHWVRQLENSERFSSIGAELVSIEDEWKLFATASAFIGSVESNADALEKVPTQAFSEIFSMVAGFMVWLGYDCGCDVSKLEELRNQNYGEERTDGGTNEEVLEAVACFLKLAVRFCNDEQACRTFEKSVENDSPTDWSERNVGWMIKINQTSKDLLQAPLKTRKAKVGDLVYLTKMKIKEMLIVSNDSSSITVVALNAENRRRKFAADSVAVIDF